MAYYTTVKVISADGKPVKAEVTCGGKNQGFTHERNGEISFEMKTSDKYSVTAKRFGETARGEVKGGGTITLRLPK